MRIIASAILVVIIAAIAAKLAFAPFHRVYTTQECRDAYANARTRADTVAVDFRPFDDGDNAVDMRCSTMRSSHRSLLGRSGVLRQ